MVAKKILIPRFEQLADEPLPEGLKWYVLDDDLLSADWLPAAIAGFSAAAHGEASDHATNWLRHSAIRQRAASRTWILALHRSDGVARIEGYYSLAAAHVRLSEDDRDTYSERDPAFERATQPAALITWIAKSDTTTIPGEVLYLHALSTALLVRQSIGVTALALDPHDEDLSRMWCEKYEFRESLMKGLGRNRRLWQALTADDYSAWS